MMIKIAWYYSEVPFFKKFNWLLDPSGEQAKKSEKNMK